MQIGNDRVVKIMMVANVLYEPPIWKPFDFTDYYGAKTGYYAFVDGMLVFKSQVLDIRSTPSSSISDSPTLFCQLPDEYTNYKVLSNPSGYIAISGGSTYFGNAVTSVDSSNHLYLDVLLTNGASGYMIGLNLAKLQISCERK